MASSRSLGTLTLDLILKLGGFKQGADQAARETDKMRKKMQADAAAITGAFKKIGATLGIGFGVSTIVSSLVEATSAAIKFGDEINRAAIKTGASTESLSELAFAAKMADVEFSDLSTGITKLQKAISEASNGNKAAVESFALLGLRVSDLKGLDADEQLELVADALKAIPDDADRAARAIDIFGKSGANLLPLFEEGARGIRAAREEAERLGLSMSGEQAKAFAEADDAITKLGLAYDGVVRSIAGLIALPLAQHLDEITKHLISQEPPLKRAWSLWQSYMGNFAPGPIGLVLQGMKALLGGTEDIADATEALGSIAPLGSKARGQAIGRGPGAAAEVAAATLRAKDEIAAAKKAAEQAANEAAKAAAERARIEAQALEELAQKYEDVYTRGAAAIAATRTESEVALDVLNEQRAALDALAEAYPNMAEAALQAKQDLEDEFLNEPLIVATRLEIPPPPKTELDQFKEHMAGEMQDLVADFLVDPFGKGFDEILSDFSAMIAQMIAQSLAADIVKKLLGGSTGGAGGFFAGLFEHGGFVAPGQFGVAGEAGPEIVMGGRTGQTVVPMAAAAAPQVNLRNINAFDSGVIRDYLLSAQGEEVMLNFIERNGTRVRMASVGG